MDRIKENISKYGLHVVKVLGDDTYPPFGYSVGLFETYNHPEILIVGLEHELIHILINNIANDIQSGSVYENANFYSGVLDDFDCYFTNITVNYYEEYVQQAINYYKTNRFPVLQCIYPTVNNVYPWQPEWPVEIANLQPLLGSIPTN